MPWGGEGRAGDLLGIEAERDLLRRVAADRQGAGHGLGLEVVAEPRLIFEVRSHQAARTAPRRIWSSSIDSNSAWKLPLPKPSLPFLWMISKKIGPTTVWVKICSRRPSSYMSPSSRMRFFL